MERAAAEALPSANQKAAPGIPPAPEQMYWQFTGRDDFNNLLGTNWQGPSPACRAPSRSASKTPLLPAKAHGFVNRYAKR
ncbi:hypothetical protein SKAU_G00317000 [Synaphobranchus kaupii]|uniref:Uncharacterized protein n=1 Tax=Synaphobranchus kaupii TaxID=118154 RepID=A0A9Q1ESU4_SYNKA|nr:hypothetical protein SKAU_G00317000 [Synaphobranchus kaupii]